jgi:hypothetical protein
MAEVKAVQSAANLSNESMFDIMRNAVRLYNCTQGELMEPHMHVAAKTVKDIDEEFILGIGDNEQDLVRFTSVVAQLASYGDILKNYLMMRAELSLGGPGESSPCSRETPSPKLWNKNHMRETRTSTGMESACVLSIFAELTLSFATRKSKRSLTGSK